MDLQPGDLLLADDWVIDSGQLDDVVSCFLNFHTLKKSVDNGIWLLASAENAGGRSSMENMTGSIWCISLKLRDFTS